MSDIITNQAVSEIEDLSSINAGLEKGIAAQGALIDELKAIVADLTANQRMSYEQARAHIGENFAALLWNADELSSTKRPWISCRRESAFAELAGSFTASDLEAIACWMRDQKGVAGE